MSAEVAREIERLWDSSHEEAASGRASVDEAIRLLDRCLEMGDAPSRYSSTVGAGTYIALVALADI
ncbi:MAG: hypothetical protein M3321_11885, partial [Actinomycetota bacterium]|nr:hypothetical protein [Actinomycetota bacterium]